MNFKNLNTLKEGVGTIVPPSEWIMITQEMINSFADATLDYQWIHVDVERAKKESPFKAPIAHGFLSVSLLSKLLESAIKIDSVKMGVNYGLNNVRFPHPVPVNSELRGHVKIEKVETYGDNGAKIYWGCTVEIKGVNKPACVAEFISLAFE